MQKTWRPAGPPTQLAQLFRRRPLWNARNKVAGTRQVDCWGGRKVKRASTYCARANLTSRLPRCTVGVHRAVNVARTRAIALFQTGNPLLGFFQLHGQIKFTSQRKTKTIKSRTKAEALDARLQSAPTSQQRRPVNMSVTMTDCCIANEMRPNKAAPLASTDWTPLAAAGTKKKFRRLPVGW